MINEEKQAVIQTVENLSENAFYHEIMEMAGFFTSKRTFEWIYLPKTTKKTIVEVENVFKQVVLDNERYNLTITLVEKDLPKLLPVITEGGQS